MYNGIGLTTPRGSGTNGHIQSNKFFVRPKNTSGKDSGGHGPGAGLPRKANRDILEHDRKRQIELKLVVLEDKLSDQGYTDSEIVEKIAEARKNLEAAAALEASREAGEIAPLSVSDNRVSDTQTHQVAARKEKQMETLRAAFGIVPDAPLKNDEPKLNSEDVIDDVDLSDGSDKDPTDAVKLHKKDPKGRNDEQTKGVKVDKNGSRRDGNELRSQKNQQNKELGELTDSSDSETDKKHLRRIPKQLQKYHRRSASETDSDEKSKNPSRGNRKGGRHDSDDSGSDDGKYAKKTREAHDKRSRRHETDKKLRRGASESDSDEKSKNPSRGTWKGGRHDNDDSGSDDDKYVKESRKAHDKRNRRHETDGVDSDDENYESERHAKKSGKHADDVKYENQKYGERYDDKSRRHGGGDSLSDYENYKRTSEQDDKKSRRHDTDFIGSGDELDKKRSDKELKGQDYDISKYKEVKYGKVHEAEKVSSIDRWNNKPEKDNKKLDARNKIDTEKIRKLAKSNENMSRNRRHDSDDDDDDKKIKKNSKSKKHDVYECSSEGTVGSGSDPEDYRRRKADSEKSKTGLRDDISGKGRNSSVIEGKSDVRSGKVDKSKEKYGSKKVDDEEDTFRKPEESYRSKRDTIEGKYGSKKVDDEEDTFRKPEDSYRSKRDTIEDRSHEKAKGKRKLEDQAEDEQPEAKSRSRTTRSELNDDQQKSFEENRRSSRNKDGTDQLTEKRSGVAHACRQVGRTYMKEEPQKETVRRSDLDRKKEELDHREPWRSDLDHEEERDRCERRRSDDRKEERESKMYRNDDNINGLIKQRKDEEREDVEGQHGRSRRRGREEREEHTTGRDEKNRHADSSKRAKYDDYRSEGKKKYDDDKRDSRDDVRGRRRD